MHITEKIPTSLQEKRTSLHQINKRNSERKEGKKGKKTKPAHNSLFFSPAHISFLRAIVSSDNKDSLQEGAADWRSSSCPLTGVPRPHQPLPFAPWVTTTGRSPRQACHSLLQSVHSRQTPATSGRTPVIGGHGQVKVRVMSSITYLSLGCRVPIT